MRKVVHAPARDLGPTDIAVVTTGSLKQTRVLVDRVEGGTATVYPLHEHLAGNSMRRETMQISTSALAKC